MMIQQHLFFFINALRDLTIKHSSHDAPETVLWVPIEKLLLS